MPSPGGIIKTLLAFVCVWLLMPHADDPQLAKPLVATSAIAALPQTGCTGQGVRTCDSLVFGAMLGSVDSLQSARGSLLEAVSRVRADIKTNVKPLHKQR